MRNYIWKGALLCPIMLANFIFCRLRKQNYLRLLKKIIFSMCVCLPAKNYTLTASSNEKDNHGVNWISLCKLPEIWTDNKIT